MPGEFHFLRPWWLLLFVPLVIFLAWFARRRFERRRWRDVVDPALMPHVLIGTGYQARRRITLVLAFAGALLITALAGPTWQRLPQPVFRSQDALVIALDLSRSMDVADVKPSRLVRARFKINDILRQRKEGQTALIAYAAQPYVISPLTDDTRTIISQLPALTTSLMPSQGSRADRALKKAAELLRQAGVNRGHILLVTDGVASGQAVPKARELAKKGIRVSVLGVGTENGGPIPGQGGFVKRKDGSIVIARFDPDGLKRLAEQGNGVFRRLSVDDSDLDRLLADVSARPQETEAAGRKTDAWREEGPWLLLVLLPLTALAFRRGVIAVWLLLLIFPYRPAAAMDWQDLWLRPDQQASRRLDEGEPAAAARLFTDPAWKGAAAYQAGRYEESLAALDGLDDTESVYNRGNALARLGRYDEAIAAYEEVLKRNPEHRDARYNLDLLRQRQKQKQQKQQGKNGASKPGNPSTDPSQAKNRQQGQADKADGQSGRQDRGGSNEKSSTGDESPATQSRADESSHENASDRRQNDDGTMAKSGQRPEEKRPLPESGNEPSGERQADQMSAQPDGSDSQGDADTDKPPAAVTRSGQPVDDRPPDEKALAAEQWLRKIPDDPGGLLRRKFYYQYQQQGGGKQEDEPW